LNSGYAQTWLQIRRNTSLKETKMKKALCLTAAFLAMALAIPFHNEVDGAGTLVLSGKSTDGDSLTITLTMSGNKWTETEPAGASKVFKTKSGVWSRAVNIVDMNGPDGKSKVAQLHPLVPENAKKGDAGKGESEELAVNFDWTVN
jgi:hypothetical protein